MALLHLRCHHHLLLHRKRYSRFRRACIIDRCPLRNADVLPPHGLHVALRQLEQQGPRNQVELLGRRKHLYTRWRILSLGFWNLWRGQGYYGCLQNLWWLGGVVLRG